MGYSISHGGTRYSYSGLSLDQLADKLRRLRKVDWATLGLIFDRHSGDPFNIQPKQAEQIGQALLDAADAMKIWDRGWAGMARQIGESALRAARSNEKWEWS